MPQRISAAELDQRLRLLPATDADFESLASLRTTAMRPSLEPLGRFDPERSRERLRKNFSPAHTHLALLDDAHVGFYALRPDGEVLRLDHLYVLPAAQNLGIGSSLMKRIIAESESQRKPIVVGALRESPANAFYQRHGFTKTSEEEWDITYTRPCANQRSTT